MLTDEEMDDAANRFQPGPYEHIDHIAFGRWVYDRALEDAAKVCEDTADERERECDAGNWDAGYCEVALRDAATSCRALKHEKPTTIEEGA